VQPVHKSGSKLWLFRFERAGRESSISLGVYPTITLNRARELADEARRQLADGIDPAVQRKRERLRREASNATTFTAVAEEWLRLQEARRAPSYTRTIRGTLNANIIPRIGRLPISEIGATDILSTLKAMETRGVHELTSRARRWIGQIIDYSIATGKREAANPCRALAQALTTPTGENFKALPFDQLGGFMRKLVEYPGVPTTRFAVELMIRCAMRPGEVRFLEWADYSERDQKIVIPAARMKARRPHTIHVSTQAVALLADLRNYTWHARLMFPSANDAEKPMSENTLAKACRLVSGSDITAHGFRATFSTHANESRLWHRDVVEVALAHALGSEVQRAYNRAQHEDERARLMQWWSDTIDAQRREAA
jgi:integrase